jgi:capsular polysaccharide transport system permease protein
MVRKVDAALDLRALWRKPAAQDPLLAFGTDPSIEALHRYWAAMIDVTYEPRQGIIGLAARAFEPEDAIAIATAIVAESRALVNRLTEAAREDAVKFTRADVTEARARLEAVRGEMRAFRDANRTILPETEVAAQATLLAALQDKLADALVDRAALGETTRPDDPRIAQADRRVAAITAQIAAERRRLAGVGGPGGGDAADGAGTIAGRLGAYEALSIELDFAAQSYLAAETAHLLARAEAARISRYANLHLEPTRPERAEYPDRAVIGLLGSALLLITWAIGVLIVWNIRDSR